jgi:BirA family transcriptional regulator, biotin operon repressor / biotin---[acetyl-CoA-carboxylase] ligase
VTIANPWLARLERFESVGSTNDIVDAWLADGTAEVCVAVADEQTAGRGRSGRSWTAPAGSALLCSLGFRPVLADPAQFWQWAAIVSLSMAEAVESVAGAAPGTVRLKWPNDLVVAEDGHVRKLAGVLGETSGTNTEDQRVVVGIGVNAGWRRADFPVDLADSMTSVAELAGPTAGAERETARALRDSLLDAFLDHLQPRVSALHANRFPGADWRARQLTNGELVRLERPDGTAETVRAIDVDAESGALVVGSLSGEWPSRLVTVGEIRHLRLGAQAGV